MQKAGLELELEDKAVRDLMLIKLCSRLQPVTTVDIFTSGWLSLQVFELELIAVCHNQRDINQGKRIGMRPSS